MRELKQTRIFQAMFVYQLSSFGCITNFENNVFEDRGVVPAVLLALFVTCLFPLFRRVSRYSILVFERMNLDDSWLHWLVN
jgi:hypothetical protein